MDKELQILIKDFIYFEEFGQGKSINTIKSFKRDLTQFKEYLEKISLKDVKKIDEMTIRGFLVELKNENIGKRSLNRKLSTIRGFFKYLKNHSIITKNPTLLLSGPTFKSKNPEILSLSEMNDIRSVINTEKVNGIRDRLILELLYSSGIRASELLALSERLFDIEERELRVVSGKQPRFVFFSKRAKEYYIQYLEGKKEKYKEKYNADILFVNGSGTRLSDRSLRRIIDRYAKKVGIEKEVSPHTLRHTFGVHMLKRGIDIQLLKELMGHVSLESTKIYERMVGQPKIIRGFTSRGENIE